MLSYPNMGGASKELQHPSLVTLAKLAEKAGLDLRILVLTRDARDLLASTTEHRGFGEVNKQAEQLADNAAVLSSQLRLIDGGFVACMHLEQLGTAATWTQPRVQGAGAAARETSSAEEGDANISYAEWLHPRIDESMVNRMLGSWKASKTHGNKETNILRTDPHVRDLAAAIALLEHDAGCPVDRSKWVYS